MISVFPHPIFSLAVKHKDSIYNPIMTDHLQNKDITLFAERFLADFIGYKGRPVFYPISSDGSQRRFLRFTDDGGFHTFILVENPPVDEILLRENVSYLKIGRHLFQQGLPLPQIYGVDLDLGLFILEDFGDRLFQDDVLPDKNREHRYKKAIELLIEMQFKGLEGFDVNWCYQTGKFDQSCMRSYESNYFRDAFLINYLGLKKDWPELEGPFDCLAQQAAGAGINAFLHRDFQSRNIMVTPKGLGIIDWQGGRLGPFPYDLASLLIDPYIGLSHDEQSYLLKYYIRCLRRKQPEYVGIIEKYYPYLAIQRNLQILGAYSFLSKVKGKTVFKKYIPPSLRSLRYLLDQLRDPRLSPLPELIRSVSDRFF